MFLSFFLFDGAKVILFFDTCKFYIQKIAFYIQICYFCKMDFTKSRFFLLVSQIFRTFAAGFKCMSSFYMFSKKNPAAIAGFSV